MSPMLDMSEAILDPMLADNFDVLRRLEQVNDDGVSVIVPYLFTDIIGVVTPESPENREMTPDAQRTRRSISVVTVFRLRATALDAVQRSYQADIVLWDCGCYLVDSLDKCTRFGAGFTEAICSSISTQDLPPGFSAQIAAATIFTDPQQADLLPAVL